MKPCRAGCTEYCAIRFLSTSKDEDIAMPLKIPQCPWTVCSSAPAGFKRRKIALMFKWKCSYINLWLLPLVCSLALTEKILSLLHSLLQVFIHNDKILSESLLQIMCSSSLRIFLPGLSFCRLVIFQFSLTVHLARLCFIHLSVKVLWKTKVGKPCWSQNKLLVYSLSATCFLINSVRLGKHYFHL